MIQAADYTILWNLLGDSENTPDGSDSLRICCLFILLFIQAGEHWYMRQIVYYITAFSETIGYNDISDIELQS